MPFRNPEAAPHQDGRGMARIRRALGHSLAGLRAAYGHEAAFRQEIWLALILIPVALLLPASAVERGLMVASVLLVLIVELLNSAVEATLDRISLTRHPLAGRAKDMGSAAVLIALLNVVVIWSLVLCG
ncbi:MAG TPA: diacylglycerol kinase [Rhodocyclaceae bacterium]|nr:diacylglycerol kinase [Rhodocyclaceae bacterium]